MRKDVSIKIRADSDGHWVEWVKNGTAGQLGPYVDVAVADRVKQAKERELVENEGNIEDGH